MGAATHRSIEEITSSKYSFAREKPEQHRTQIAVWRYSDDQLELQFSQIHGVSMPWPYKLYSDEGYIVTVIENQAIILEQELERQSNIANFSFSANMSEVLYSFSSGQVKEYYVSRMNLNSTIANKFNLTKERLYLTIYILAGEHLNSAQTLKLLYICHVFESYIEAGGSNSLSKLYHEYDRIANVSEEFGTHFDPKEFRVKLDALQGDSTAGEVFESLQAFKVVKRLVFSSLADQPSNVLNSKYRDRYPLINHEPYLKLINKSVPEQKSLHQMSEVHQNLDENPFACEITEINLKHARKNERQELDESNLGCSELDLLKEDRVRFLNIGCDQDSDIILCDYFSVRQFSKLQEMNVVLIVNCDGENCFNYFINDIDYIWYDLKNASNIQCIIEPLVQVIHSYTLGNINGKAGNRHVLIHHAQKDLFTQEIFALLLGYYIVRHQYSYKRAFSALNELFQTETNVLYQFPLKAEYVEQLKTLESRVIPNLEKHCVANNNRVYQITYFSAEYPSHIVAQFLGEISNPNQLQTIQNYSKNAFITLANGATQHLSIFLEKYSKDPKNPKIYNHFPNIKFIHGKEFIYKDEYVKASTKIISNILKYEFVNRKKHADILQAQNIDEVLLKLVEINIQTEVIEKSFRRPIPFVPLIFGSLDKTQMKPVTKLYEPFNQKEKLYFKYPILRPTWEAVKDDGYYFVIRRMNGGSNVQMLQGKQWIGYQEDRQNFFDRIVKIYLKDIPEDKIWIVNEEEQSIFDGEISII